MGHVTEMEIVREHSLERSSKYTVSKWKGQIANRLCVVPQGKNMTENKAILILHSVIPFVST